jgi:ABC-type transporter MlaC component
MVVDSMGIRDSVNTEDKVGRAKASLLANMDFDSMAKQALGRANYNKMTDKEFVEYKKDYITYFVNVYTKNIDKYVKDVQEGKRIVASEIIAE